MPNRQSAAGGFSPVPCGGLHLGTDQLNLVNGSEILVELDTLLSGFTDGIEDTTNHKITPGVAGLYLISAAVIFKNIVNDKTYRLSVKDNSTRIIDAYLPSSVATISKFVTIAEAKPVWLSAVSEIKLYACSFSGDDTVDVFGFGGHTFLTVCRMR